MNENLTLELPADCWRRALQSMLAAAWSQNAADEWAVAARDVFLAYCKAYGADPGHMAESLPYSVDIHARLYNAPQSSSSRVDSEPLDD